MKIAVITTLLTKRDMYINSSHILCKEVKWLNSEKVIMYGIMIIF
jgi:hypothetical protein